ncbi:hypothetical protein ACWEKT_07495 [Nocardia takedensis]
MSSTDGGMPWDRRTTQDEYYAHIVRLRANPADERLMALAARLEQQGPPPPSWNDDARRWLGWYARHVPTPEGFAQLLGRLTSEGLLTSAEAVSYATRPAADSVAELVARVQAIDAIAQARQDEEVPG